MFFNVNVILTSLINGRSLCLAEGCWIDPEHPKRHRDVIVWLWHGSTITNKPREKGAYSIYHFLFCFANMHLRRKDRCIQIVRRVALSSYKNLDQINDDSKFYWLFYWLNFFFETLCSTDIVMDPEFHVGCTEWSVDEKGIKIITQCKELEINIGCSEMSAKVKFTFH